MILEYKLHMTAKGMMRPEWVEDGGYWAKSDHTMIGWSPDESKREYYIPDTVTTLTATELETRVLAIHSDTPYSDNDPADPKEMTTDQVKKWVSDWVAARES